MDGAALSVEGRPWTKHKDGAVTLVLHKDRPGDVPAAVGERAAMVVGRYEDSGALRLQIVPPKDKSDAQPVADAMLEALADTQGGFSGTRGYRELVEASSSLADSAMSILIAAGHLDRRKKGQAWHYFVTADGFEALAWTCRRSRRRCCEAA